MAAADMSRLSRVEPDAIPRFHLYGEPPDDVDRAFLHVETIPRRSRLHDWTIRAHAHPDHHQILVLTQGRAAVALEEKERELDAPASVVVPALAVHGFRFDPGADGYVLTIATPFLTEATEGDADLGAAFSGTGRCLAGDEESGIAEACRSVAWEIVRSAPGRRIAIKLHLQRILVAVARHRSAPPDGVSNERSRDAAIVVRYRGLIEREFRNQPSLAILAGGLGVTTARLNAACRSTTGRSAMTLVHDRVMVEAKRNLLYTGLTVAEVARSVGFADPAYFNRFFSRRTGMSPGAFRRMDRAKP